MDFKYTDLDENYQLVELKSEGKDLQEFIELPYRLFEEHPYWVPVPRFMVQQNLNIEKNPFYKSNELKLWGVRDHSGRLVGRIAGIRKKTASNDKPQSNKIHFGFFESIPSPIVSKLLFDQLKKWGSDSQAETIEGPYCPSTNHECGLLVDGFQDTPALMTPYHPDYYQWLFNDYGWDKAKDLLAYELFSNETFDPKLHQRSKELELSDKISIQKINLNKFWDEIKVIHQIYNDAWEKNWGFEPLSEKEFLQIAKEMKPLIDPDFVLIARVDGKPAGFSLVLPDLNQAFQRHRSGKANAIGLAKWWWYSAGPGRRSAIRRVRVFTLGVTQEFRHLNLGPALYTRIREAAARKGYVGGEASWILEDNIPMNKALERMRGRVSKRYRIYQLAVQ